MPFRQGSLAGRINTQTFQSVGIAQAFTTDPALGIRVAVLYLAPADTDFDGHGNLLIFLGGGFADRCFFGNSLPHPLCVGSFLPCDLLPCDAGFYVTVLETMATGVGIPALLPITLPAAGSSRSCPRHISASSGLWLCRASLAALA